MFFRKTGSNMEYPLMLLTSKFVFLGNIFLTRYFWNQTEIVCQSYVPRKIDVPIYTNVANRFGTSSTRVRFLDV